MLPLQICRSDILHLPGEVAVRARHIELTVGNPACQIGIARADPCPATIGDRGLGMQHRPVPLEDPHPGLQQGAISRFRQGPDQGPVARARNQETNINPDPRSTPQGAHIGGCRRRNSRRSTTGSAPPRPRPTAPAGTAPSLRGDRRSPIRRTRPPPAPARPRAAACPRRRSPSYRRRPPRYQPPPAREFPPPYRARGHAARRIAHPVVTDAKPAGEGQGAIDTEDLPVVAADQPHRVHKARRIVTAHLHPRFGKPPPESLRGSGEAAQPVINDLAGNSSLPGADQRGGKGSTDLILFDNVIFQMHARRGAIDLLQPDCESLWPVAQNPQMIA